MPYRQFFWAPPNSNLAMACTITFSHCLCQWIKTTEYPSPIRSALLLCLCPALAGASVWAQAPQLSDSIPGALSALGSLAYHTLLLLLPRYSQGQPPGAIAFLASLLLPCLPAVLHTDAYEPLLCTGNHGNRCGGSRRAIPRVQRSDRYLCS